MPETELNRAARRRISARYAKLRRARTSAVDCLEHCWWMRHDLVIGKHTEAICGAFDDAIARYQAGTSTFLDIVVPFRHGKSDLVSRFFHPYFLARCFDQDPDTIMSGYGMSLVAGFSNTAKRIIRSGPYRQLWPHIEVGGKGQSDRNDEWGINGQQGRVTAQGIGGALAGKGGSYMSFDDYCKSRAEAESEAYRDRTWGAYTDDFMTRRPDVAIVILCATSWHVDDVRGRQDARMTADPDYPRFQKIHFAAGGGKTGKPILFPERFSETWYREQRATLSEYGAAALMDGDPQVRGGNLLKTDRIQIHDTLEGWPKTRHIRAWDLASTAKQRAKDDPDFTWGALGTVTWEKNQDGDRQPHLWIKHSAYVQAEAPERDRLIQKTSDADGSLVPIWVEELGPQGKDTKANLKKALAGKRTVNGAKLPGDKLVKATPLEPIFEKGNVHLLRGDWNTEWIKQHSEFTGKDGGSHDDAVDTSAIIYHKTGESGAYMAIPGKA